MRRLVELSEVLGAETIIPYTRRMLQNSRRKYRFLMVGLHAAGMLNCLRFAHPAEAIRGLEVWMLGGNKAMRD